MDEESKIIIEQFASNYTVSNTVLPDSPTRQVRQLRSHYGSSTGDARKLLKIYKVFRRNKRSPEALQILVEEAFRIGKDFGVYRVASMMRIGNFTMPVSVLLSMGIDRVGIHYLLSVMLEEKTKELKDIEDFT